MIAREQFDRFNKLTEDELLANDTVEAAQFLIDRQDMAEKAGLSWWELRGKDWETWCAMTAGHFPQPATAQPQRKRTIEEIEADSALIVAAEKAAAVKADPWAATIEKAKRGELHGGR